MQLIISRLAYHYTSVLNGLKSYKNSAAQAHLHRYVREEEDLRAIKKTIDYKTINKNSKGVFRFREFLFQQKVEQNYIAPLNLRLLPVGKWTREDLKNVQTGQEQTKTEEINSDIITNCSPALENVFKQYYKNIGKPTYHFILTEEIGKISKMTPEEFQKFKAILGEGRSQSN